MAECGAKKRNEQLWSGAIGSLIAAVIGGFVALLVVRMTNRQARRNAADERMVNAIAELGAELRAFGINFDSMEHFDPRREYLSLEARLIKLRLSSIEDPRLVEVLENLPMLLTKLAMASHASSTGMPNSRTVTGLLEQSVLSLGLDVEAWASGSKAVKKFAVEDAERAVRRLQQADRSVEDQSWIDLQGESPEDVAWRKQRLSPSRRWGWLHGFRRRITHRSIGRSRLGSASDESWRG